MSHIVYDGSVLNKFCALESKVTALKLFTVEFCQTGHIFRAEHHKLRMIHSTVD